MLKKTITWEDFDGNKRTETFYFNLTPAEVTKMELSTKGGLAATIEKLVAEQENALIIAMFQDVIGKAYGEKSQDGKFFVKKPELTEAFMSTGAYSVLFMELATDAKAAAAFIEGIVPKKLTHDEIKKGA
jgi:hypothetical protein